MVKITLRETKCGYLVVASDGRDRFLQFESDIVGLARVFGWSIGADASDPSRDSSVVEYLAESAAGRWIDDPGYFG